MAERRPALEEAARDLVHHIGRILDDWAEVGPGEARNKSLWTPLHVKADAVRRALGEPTDTDAPAVPSPRSGVPAITERAATAIRADLDAARARLDAAGYQLPETGPQP